ncbi:hypothetical protein EYS14_02320 [Alteromonadaceae bacterium M269]|nr:hypothetical protein EYS14_02320 [Alteromonadaceae bacterium M269]
MKLSIKMKGGDLRVSDASINKKEKAIENVDDGLYVNRWFTLCDVKKNIHQTLSVRYVVQACKTF